MMSAHDAAGIASDVARCADGAPSLDDRGVFLLSQLGHHAATRCGELLAPLDLQPAHYGVLMHLCPKDGLSQQQLADRIGVHRNIMVGLIDQLEARDLVRRDRDPHDRRVYRLHLTERAHTVIDKANTTLDGLEDEFFGDLDSTARAQFVALLSRTARRAELPVGIHPGLRQRRRHVPE
jgi:DNA-binding MarR family transcriptional regulator